MICPRSARASVLTVIIATVFQWFLLLQVVTEYDDSSEERVREACERMSHHLTAAVVSNEPRFLGRMLQACP